jgi:lipopolysaccharide assembly protein A
MLRGLITALFALPFTLLIILFAVSNRALVTVELFPLPGQAILPLYLLVLPLLALSFFLGALLMWVLGHGARATARRESKRAQKLEKELGSLRVAALGLDAPPAAGSTSALLVPHP